MTASVFASIFFVVSFLALFIAVHLIKKTDKILNRIIWMIIDFITILCWGTLIGGILDICSVPINIWSMGVAYFISALVVGLYLYKTRRTQKYKVEVFDIFYIALFSIVLFIVLGKMTSSSLQLVFYNSDAAVHLKNTMNVVRHQKLPTMYMTELHNALIMEVFMPLIAEVNMYKLFILIDAFFFLLEVIFFMVIIRDYLTSKSMKVIGIIICALYTLGYPLNSYLFTFLYWGVGVMLIAYLLLCLRMYQNHTIDEKYNLVMIMMGCNAVTMCYMLFGPIVYVAVFFCLVAIQRRKGKVFTWSNMRLALAVFLLPCMMSIYYCYFRFLLAEGMSVSEVISISGGIYNELYINFIWILPFVVYEFVQQIKNKKLDENMISFICVLALTIVLAVLVTKGKVSYYYYFKFYYPLWMIGFVITVKAVAELWRDNRAILAGYVSVFVLLAYMCFTNTENNLIASGTGIQSTNKSNNFFDLYLYNKSMYQNTHLMYPEEYFDACNYVIENLDDEETVPLLATIESYSNCYWYEAITGEDCSDYYGWDNTVEEICAKFKENGIRHFVVYTDSPMYAWNAAYFDERYNHLYQNARAIIYEVGDE